MLQKIVDSKEEQDASEQKIQVLAEKLKELVSSHQALLQELQQQRELSAGLQQRTQTLEAAEQKRVKEEPAKRCAEDAHRLCDKFFNENSLLFIQLPGTVTKDVVDSLSKEDIDPRLLQEVQTEALSSVNEYLSLWKKQTSTIIVICVVSNLLSAVKA